MVTGKFETTSVTHFIFLLNSGDLEDNDHPTHLNIYPECLPPASWTPHQWALCSAQHRTFPASLFRPYPTHPALQPISITRSVQQQLSHPSECGTILCQDPLSAPTPPTWV